MIKKITLIITLLLLSSKAFATSFQDVIIHLKNHESVDSVMMRSSSLRELAKTQGSFGDPIFKISAKNYPKSSLKSNVTPMTGVEFSLSQKVALTTKYGNIQSALTSSSNAEKFTAEDKKNFLIKSLWEILIIRRKIQSEINILKENMNWITKILKISKKLYANGKTSQQAILDIQIRKSEIESLLNNKHFEISQIKDRLLYLIKNKDSKFNHKSVPWKILSSKKSDLKDFKELSLREKVKSKEFTHTAAKLNFIPDLTIALAYTKRSKIDNQGDFVSAMVSFPLPISSQKYSNQKKAIHEKHEVIKKYENYKNLKKRDASLFSKEIKKLQAEILILSQKTIKFARNSRTITSKSYGLGNSTYLELLQSELKLQKILLKKVMLVAKRDIKKVTLKYIIGESLYE